MDEPDDSVVHTQLASKPQDVDELRAEHAMRQFALVLSQRHCDTPLQSACVVSSEQLSRHTPLALSHKHCGSLLQLERSPYV